MFYFIYVGCAAIYLHDPATMVAAVDPSLMTYATGAVRVQKDGICKGLTLFNNSNKVYCSKFLTFTNLFFIPCVRVMYWSSLSYLFNFIFIIQ